jgi:hypothetical protein
VEGRTDTEKVNLIAISCFTISAKMWIDSFPVDQFLSDVKVSVIFFTLIKYVCGHYKVYLFFVSAFYKITVFLIHQQKTKNRYNLCNCLITLTFVFKFTKRTYLLHRGT